MGIGAIETRPVHTQSAECIQQYSEPLRFEFDNLMVFRGQLYARKVDGDL